MTIPKQQEVRVAVVVARAWLGLRFQNELVEHLLWRPVMVRLVEDASVVLGMQEVVEESALWLSSWRRVMFSAFG